MKQISAELAQHIDQSVTTIATCWKVTRVDGVILGFTDHHNDVLFGGVVYKQKAGLSVIKTQQSAYISGDSTLITAIIGDDSLSDADIVAGLYNYAHVEIFELNYQDLSQGIIMLRSGWLGEITVVNGQFSAEMSGLSQRLEKTIGERYSPSCRARLGDGRCGVDISSLTVTGSITQVGDRRNFSDSSRIEASGVFNFGKLTFTSGLNIGLSMEVKEYRGAAFELVLPIAFDLAVGDTYSAEPGCDKEFSTCVERYTNSINFRGEPHLPGLDNLLKTSGTL